MAIIKSAIKIIIREADNYKYSGPMLSLGVPEIHATYEELQSWFPKLTGQSCELKPADVKYTANETGKKLGWVTFNTFFKALGISEISTLDIPGCEHEPDLLHDLNQPLPENFTNRFNLVFDPATIEHVFDTKTGLANIVRALKVGGTVVQLAPIYSYNGGYYSINPNVINDFYRKNGFGDMKIFVIMWDRYRAYAGNHRCYEYSDEILGGRHALADYDQARFSPHLLLLARKIEDLPEIHVPLQYEGNYLTSQPESDSRLSSKIKRYGSVLLNTFLPFHLAFYMKSWAARKTQLFKIRRKSFWI